MINQLPLNSNNEAGITDRLGERKNCQSGFGKRGVKRAGAGAKRK